MSTPIDAEALCRQTAHIMGEFSGAAQALRLLEAKRSAGFGAWVWLEGGRWLVGWREAAKSEARQ